MYDTTDSNKNESYFNDDNGKYREPTCNDLDPNVGVGYTSFDDHNETRPIEDKTINIQSPLVMI